MSDEASADAMAGAGVGASVGASVGSELSPASAGELPQFDARYRWVLLFCLQWLREVPQVDLDDPEQLDAAYGFMSSFVQEYVQRRGLSGKLDPMKVAAIADSPAARSTVEKILVKWMESK